MPEVALYYPYIDPPSSTMLKTAVLYWDELHTIVPESMEHPYQTQTTKAAADLGFLKRRDVGREMPEVKLASKEFEDDFERKALQKDCDLARREASLPKSKPAWIHPDKVSSMLGHLLLDHGPSTSGGFLETAEGFASPYMSKLASIIAAKDGSIPTTDRTTSHDVIVDRFIEVRKANRAAMAQAALATCSIEAIGILEDTPMVRLFSFREKHYDELVRFRRAIRNFARQIGSVESADDLDRAVRQVIEDEVLPSREEVNAKMQECGLTATKAVVKTALVSANTAIIGAMFGGGLGATIGAITGAAIELGICAADWRSGKKQAASAPFGYLIAAERELS